MPATDTYRKITDWFGGLDRQLAEGLGLTRRRPQSATPFLDYKMGQLAEEEKNGNGKKPPEAIEPMASPGNVFRGPAQAAAPAPFMAGIDQPGGFMPETPIERYPSGESPFMEFLRSQSFPSHLEPGITEEEKRKRIIDQGFMNILGMIGGVGGKAGKGLMGKGEPFRPALEAELAKLQTPGGRLTKAREARVRVIQQQLLELDAKATRAKPVPKVEGLTAEDQAITDINALYNKAQTKDELVFAIDDEIKGLQTELQARSAPFHARMKSQPGTRDIPTADLDARLNVFTNFKESLPEVDLPIRTVGTGQMGMGIGEKPPQAAMLPEFGGAGEKIPLADAQQIVLRQAREAAIARGQAPMPEAPGAPAKPAAEAARGLLEWEMTQSQFIAESQRTAPPYLRGRGTAEGLAASHERYVRRALSEGKAIPREVLADYPDLMAKAPVAAAKKTFGQQLMEDIASLDARNASDLEYRGLLSTATRDTLKQGETWRDHVLMYAQNDLKRHPPAAIAEAPAAAARPVAAPRIPPSPFAKGPFPRPQPIAPAQAPPSVPPVKPPKVTEVPPVAGGSPPAPGAMPDLQKFDELVSVNFAPDNASRLAQLPGVKQLLGTFNPAAVAKDPVRQSVVGLQMLYHEGGLKADIAFSRLGALGSQRKVFGALDNSGLLAEGPFKGLTVNTLRTYPQKYLDKMLPVQRQWIEEAAALEREKLALLKRNAIPINELTFEDGGQYAGRRVFAKILPEGEVIETAFIGAGPGRPGAKLAAEKHRIYETAEEAIKDGFRYLTEDEALYLNMRGAYRRVAQEQMKDWLLSKIEWRTMETPEGAKIGAFVAKQSLNRARQLLAGLNRAVRGERLPDSTIASIGRSFPEEAQQLRSLVPELQKRAPETAKAVQSLQIKANQLIKSSQSEYWEAVSLRSKAREAAMRPTFEEAALYDIPAFAGKIFTGPEAKQSVEILRNALHSDFSQALAALNKVNAIGRFFALAGDASPFTIQLIFLAGERPTIYGKAMGGFVKALFDSAFQAKYLRNNSEFLLGKTRNLITASSGTEFTEAVAKGGWLSGDIHLLPTGEQGFKTAALLVPRTVGKAGGIVLKPFQRGFEAALDVAGIELRKAYDYLCTTPGRTAQVEQWINEFRGLTSSARLGVTTKTRQAETVVLLAPRYNRAIAALLFDVVRGNLRGHLARTSLARGVAALSAMAVAISLARRETKERIIQHLTPGNKWFFTWDVGGQMVGPGSKVRSVAMLFANIVENPGKLDNFGIDPYSTNSYRQNPILKFGRGNLSPVISTGLDILTGQDYLGEPTRDNMLQFSEHLLAENLLPIWLQSVVLEGDTAKQRALRGAAEFMGGRAYPITKEAIIWDLRDKWQPDLKPYNTLPSNVNEAKAKGVSTRTAYRTKYALVDAKLFITGQVSSLQTNAAFSHAVRLMEENNLTIEDIPSLKAEPYESKEHKALRQRFERALGVPATTQQPAPTVPGPKPTPVPGRTPAPAQISWPTPTAIAWPTPTAVR